MGVTVTDIDALTDTETVHDALARDEALPKVDAVAITVADTENEPALDSLGSADAVAAGSRHTA